MYKRDAKLALKNYNIEVDDKSLKMVMIIIRRAAGVSTL